MAERHENLNNIFSVRIVSIDYYMTPPIPEFDICYSSFQGGMVNEVPVIRVYGSTPAGQKTCLHVHRALPYFFVPCKDIPLNLDQEGDAYIYSISIALEKALKLKCNAGSKRQCVHGSELVRAKKFYGYHPSEELFVKIYLKYLMDTLTSLRYHPNDVSRAANLILGGAILDRSLQPHESHIPFILQFMIDYNLYGMGLLHVSSMKFRHPVPDAFAERKIGQLMKETDSPSCTSESFQADSSVDLGLRSHVWISTTIPGDWMWQLPDRLCTASYQENHYVQRQSVCQLEGDCTVNEILNVQFKMYTSFSQTNSDVKMVQSLIQIWEEEFERSGVSGEVLAPDHGKPLPHDVLKSLSLGVELSSKFVDFCNESQCHIASLEHDPNFVSVASSISHVQSAEVELTDFGCGEVALEDQGICTTINEDEDVHLQRFAHSESLSPGMTETLHPKATDAEALGLLRWLATSHAVEEINSDDELVRETILSPFLPSTTINEVLNKANMEYESASQKECQDILDSVEDVTNCGSMNCRSSNLIEEKISQVDGSHDKLCLAPYLGLAESLPKRDTTSKYKRTSQPKKLLKDSTSSTGQNKGKKLLQGPLPFTTIQCESGNIEDDSFSVVVNGKNEAIITSSTSGKDAKQRSDALMMDDVSYTFDSKEVSTSTRCSVRDLMRKNRCFRLEHTTESSSGKRLILEKEQKEDITICPNWLGNPRKSKYEHDKEYVWSPNKRDTISKQEARFLDTCVPAPNSSDNAIHGRQLLFPCSDRSLPTNSVHTGRKELQSLNNSNKKDSSFSACHLTMDGNRETRCLVSCTEGIAKDSCNALSGFPFDATNRTKDACIKNEGVTSSEEQHDIFNDNPASIVAKTHCSVLMRESYRNEDQGANYPYMIGTIAPVVEKMDTKPEGLVGMTFCRKPPAPEWKTRCYEDSAASLMENSYGEIVEGSSSSEFLPFFGREDPEEVVLDKCIGDGESNICKEGFISVPTFYENHGCRLYLLTPVMSPPTVENVSRWLTLHDEGTLGGRNKAGRKDLLPNSAAVSTIDSASPMTYNGREPLVECGFKVQKVPLPDKLQKGIEEGIESENNVIHDKVTPSIHEQSILIPHGSANSAEDTSQISGPDKRSKSTPLSQLGFQDPASLGYGQNLTLLSIEVQAACLGDMRPDPRFDAINIIVLVVHDDSDHINQIYVLLLGNTESQQRNLDAISGCKVFEFHDEKQLFGHFMMILNSYDPDILMGWDIQGGSLGFLAERAAFLGIGLLKSISRTPTEIKIPAGESEVSLKNLPDMNESQNAGSLLLEDAIIDDEWGRTHASGVHVGGRIVLNIWRLMRGEVKLNMYSIEAVVEAVLRRKIPAIPHKTLTKWFLSGPGRARYRCMEYMMERAKLNLELINQLDMVNRTSELARVFGIDFFSVLSRGSQYRVESMLLRLARTQNYIAISPGNQQVASQPAMECIPLVMEPESGFYADPVVVLDFQSLYPSMIIAYNLCFCTCLGKIATSEANRLGVSSFSADPLMLQDLVDQILLTPNGVMYVPEKVRKGVLPRLLDEILSTRIMVKQNMKKLSPSQQVLRRIFDARQLALKLIANVTYGYTAAGFSGRMPCAELADSIVQCGRSTLEKAISLVSTNDRWNAKVIYGDTDSMFVLLEGRSVEESFQIGQEIAAAVTAMNPYPVTLKMEKVYHPCFLLTKKRYVGYSYESPSQMKPVFDAKGIETVRRDTCGVVSKTMEQSLRVFFQHQTISPVKTYLQRQWGRIISGRVSLMDFVFAKEVRLGTYRARTASSLPPAAIVATKAMNLDPRAEPRYAERVAYVVIHGEPGSRLVDMVVDPLDLLSMDSPYRLNDLYYINKQIIPALQRVFGLVGANLNKWFDEMPRPVREAVTKRPVFGSNSHRTRIDYYYMSKHCILCGELLEPSTHICQKCLQNETAAVTALIGRTSKLEREMHHLASICRHCGGGDWVDESGVKCISLACGVFYERRKVQKQLRGISGVVVDESIYPRCTVEWF